MFPLLKPMCAINGFNFKDEALIKQMNQDTSHRGPDGTGVFLDQGISLGHNRLSIIDLSSRASQPMIDNDQRLVIIFNGEIYNFEQLKEALPGYEFKTKSDTEVILAGYKRWGCGVVAKLNGIFAFAIWDKKKSMLLLARDRSGVKPLYYAWDGKRLAFASEIKALLAHDVARKLNHEAFNHYLRVQYVPSPMTMLEGISSLVPGSMLTLSGHDLQIESYVPKALQTATFSYKTAKDEVRSLTIQAVRRQLVADVPVGVYLSGGIDSSVVLFAMSQFQKNIRTFSVGFDLTEEEEQEKFNHDFELAKQTAAFFGSEHYPVMLSGEDVADSFEEMVIQNDNPISNPTAVAMLQLARRAKQDVTVVLTGNGGDELFGGYERYRLALLVAQYRRVPGFLRALGDIHPTLRKGNVQKDIDLFARFMFEKDPKLARVVSAVVWRNDSRTKRYFSANYLSRLPGDRVSRFMETDRTSWLPDQALALADKMSMKSGLEERVPFLDNDLIDFATSLPRHYKVTPFHTKKILKDAFRHDLPDVLFSQPKRGWYAPGAKWLRHVKVAQMAREILSPAYYEGTEDAFNWREVSVMLDSHINKTEYNITILWALMTFQVWARNYKVVV